MTAMKIVGYDHNTEGLAVEVPVPADAVGAARLIANVPASNPDLVTTYPLTKDQARAIGQRPPWLMSGRGRVRCGRRSTS